MKIYEYIIIACIAFINGCVWMRAVIAFGIIIPYTVLLGDGAAHAIVRAIQHTPLWVGGIISVILVLCIGKSVLNMVLKIGRA
jgi:hypothetical protein